MPANQERNSTQGSNENSSSLNQQNAKKQSSSSSERSGGKCGMWKSDSQQKSSPSRDRDQDR